MDISEAIWGTEITAVLPDMAAALEITPRAFVLTNTFPHVLPTANASRWA